MSDVERLVAAFEAGELLRPSADVPNIVDLGNAIAASAGIEGPSGSPNAHDIAELIGPSKHLVFIAADGLGIETVDALGDDSFIAKRVAMRLRTVFPSSTPVVFTSLATGLWPNRHAVIGWHMYLKECDCVSTIIRFHRRSDENDLAKLGVSPEQTYPAPSMAGRFKWDSLSLLPEQIADSVYAAYVAGGTPRQGYKTLHAAIDAVTRRISKSQGPTFTYLYSPNVDTAAHVYGSGHDNVIAVARELDREVERLASQLPGDTRVVMTADHGLLDADASEVHEIEPADEMVRCLNREPWGDERAVQLELKDGEDERFGDIFRERLGDEFYLISTEDAEQLELYGPGPITQRTTRRLGSHIAISKGAGVIRFLYPTTAKRGPPKASSHSGLTPSEMLVPLVVA